ncbi:MAG: hypothetical protein HFJ50_07005 [Clostridia bacterium]|jgi:hypothetical protein|nr:hypothetical protein [Clostridia bacterium]
MEFKKCERCGSFFVTDGDVCQNCTPKDRLDLQKFNNYLGNNNISDYSANNISINTGISLKTVNRFLSQNEKEA